MKFYDNGSGLVGGLNEVCSELGKGGDVEKRKAKILDNFLADLADMGDCEGDIIVYSSKVVQRTVQLAQEYNDIVCNLVEGIKLLKMNKL